MKKIIITLLCGFLFSSVYTQEPELKQAPLNPEYIQYMEALQKGEVREFTSDGYPLGYIPHPVKYRPEIPANFQKALDLPATYDLRTEGLVTPPKDQGNCGCCWVFASIGAVESNWLTLGLGIYDLSEQHLKNTHGFKRKHCIEGGNASMATAYFIRGSGPVSETDLPYNISDSTSAPGIIPQGYVTDVRFIPNLISIIKQAIYDNGAVFSNMYWDYAYYNNSNKTYYFNGTIQANHAVLLVGWNDNKNTGGGLGAWIVKNSYGTNFGENGYFYISYNDTRVNTDVAYWPKRMDYNSSATVYYCDKLGSMGSIGYNNSQAYGLVKYAPSQNEQLTKLGTWINTSNTTVNFTVYDNFNGNSLSNLLGSIGDKTCDYPGYYTFNLTSPITVSNGNDFYIKVKYSAPGEDLPVPVEQQVVNYAEPDIETGKCWISSNGLNNTWSPLGNDQEGKFDLCIKAYGVVPGTSVETGDEKRPEKFVVHQNYPNPFNPETTIKYELPNPQHVTLKVYDITGREVATLVDQKQETGYYQVQFDASQLPSGIYMCHITAGPYSQTMKLTLLK
ncbi:T9SS type A sorting domain-containing protein [bacterium]|nr:T9SS type A sorting domain-containing protein [bacterium]